MYRSKTGRMLSTDRARTMGMPHGSKSLLLMRECITLETCCPLTDPARLRNAARFPCFLSGWLCYQQAARLADLQVGSVLALGSKFAPCYVAVSQKTTREGCLESKRPRSAMGWPYRTQCCCPLYWLSSIEARETAILDDDGKMVRL